MLRTTLSRGSRRTVLAFLALILASAFCYGLTAFADKAEAASEEFYWFVHSDKALVLKNTNTPEAAHGTTTGPYPGSSYPGYGWNYREEIQQIEITTPITPTGEGQWFFGGYKSAKSISGLKNLDTSKLTNMNQMFEQCSNVTSLDLSSFNTAHIGSMYAMFQGCSNLASLDLSSFDTSKVKSMEKMFDGCTKLSTLKLGPRFEFVRGSSGFAAALPEPPSTAPYTGKWVGPGGKFTSNELMEKYDGATMVGTYVWERTDRKNIARAKIEAIAEQAYTGKAITPALVVTMDGVTLRAGTDYTVSYKNNTNAGTATVTVTGNGVFTGTKSATFRILPPSQPEGIFKRLAGGNAYGTMAAIAQEGWADGADTVIVANFDGYWDALAASSLAGKHNAPILLTGKDALDATTAAELGRLKPKSAIVVGGRGSVSDAVVAQIRAKGAATSRFAGGNAPQTAVAIAKQVAGASDTCIIATSKGFHDALAVSPYAYAKQAPIYLTDAYGELSDETFLAIRAGGFKRAVIVGGRGSVSPRTEGELREDAGIADVQRKAGATAVETSVEFAKFAIGQGMSANFMGVATTDSFYDALTGGPLCGKKGGVLVLANGANASASAIPAAHKSAMVRGYILGGSGSVPAAVEQAFDASTAGASPKAATGKAARI